MLWRSPQVAGTACSLAVPPLLSPSLPSLLRPSFHLESLLLSQRTGCPPKTFLCATSKYPLICSPGGEEHVNFIVMGEKEGYFDVI